MQRGRPLSGGTLALRVTLLAVAVGLLVTLGAAVDGLGGCSRVAAQGLQPGRADQVCFSLVRTLAERMGVVSAGATAVIVLTMVGLSRLASLTREAVPPMDFERGSDPALDRPPT